MIVPGSDRKVSLSHRLYNGEAGLDVVGHSKLIYKVTAVVVLVCLLSMIFRGFNFGIDFEGGNSFKVPGTSEQLTEVRTAAEDAGAEVATAQVVGGNTVLLRTGQLGVERGAHGPRRHRRGGRRRRRGGQPRVGERRLGQRHHRPGADRPRGLPRRRRRVPRPAVRAEDGRRRDGLTAARHHPDRRRLLADRLRGHARRRSSASSTILGFSLYDTVVVFDKVDENTKDLERGARMTWSEAANLAINQTLMRSINTSIIALLPVAGLLFVGAGLLGVGTLKDLALVLFVGLAAGTYSSIFLATPIVADLKEREPENIALRRRVLARRSAASRKAGAAVPAVRSAQWPARARRSGSWSRSPSATSPARCDADSSSSRRRSVRREPGSGGTSTPRPGARPQRPGTTRRGKRRR